MILDPAAENPSFTDGRLPDQVEDLVIWLRERMKVPADTEWSVISARRKFGKELLEIEASGPDGSMRMIAKTGKPHRIRLNYEALAALWDAGFQPPAELTVPKPIAYFRERDLLVQEKAPGVDLLTKIRGGSCGPSASASAARWLAAVHASSVPFLAWEVDSGVFPASMDELASMVEPAQSLEITRISDQAQAILKRRRSELVPAHGDFHPLNIFIADSGRITGIDMDKFGGRDRSEEVAYALAQIACIGHHRMGNFDSSLPCRRAFLTAYENACGKRLDHARLGAYMAVTVVKNLHFELFACKTGRTELLEPWLAAASECLKGDLEIRDLY